MYEFPRSDRCRRRLQVTVPPFEAGDETHFSLLCGRKKGHDGRCWFPSLQMTASKAQEGGVTLVIGTRKG